MPNLFFLLYICKTFGYGLPPCIPQGLLSGGPVRVAVHIKLYNSMAAVSGEFYLYNTGKSYRILDLDIETYVECDDLGRPASRVRGARITCTIVTPKPSDSDLYEWLSSGTMKNGYILFTPENYRSSSYSVGRIIDFDNSYCISIREYFNCASTGQMCMQFTIQPGIIRPARRVTSAGGAYASVKDDPSSLIMFPIPKSGGA